VATWESWEDGGADSNVVASLFHATGAPLSDSEFVVSESVVGVQHSARVASLADGRFVVVWASCGIQGEQCDVHGRRFDATGEPVGGEFAVNTFTPGQQGLYQDGGGLQVAAFPDDSFGVVWCSEAQAGEGWDVYLQRFGWDGGRLYR
jgi:large repetitive protein